MGRRRKSEFPEVSIHKTHGRARLRFGGRDIWLGKAGTREAEENRQRVLAAWLANGNQLPDGFTLKAEEPAVVVPASLTLKATSRNGLRVGELVSIALVDVAGGKTKADLRSNSRWWRLRAAAEALEPYADMPAIEFGPRALGQVCRWLATTPMRKLKDGQQVLRTRTWCREVVEAIRRIFRDAVAREDLPPERLVALESLRPLPGIDKARDPIEREPVPADVFEATLALMPKVLGDLLHFMWLTSCRPSEACRIARCEVDTTREPWVWSPRTHKTKRRGKRRHIAVGPRARAILLRWWAGKGDGDPVFGRDDMEPPAGSVVKFRALRTDQEPFDSADLARRVARTCKANGIPHWSPYQVRHSGLSELRAAGGVDAAQAQGGHSSVQVTERYARPSVARQAAAVEALG